jgi:hypothetical protein
MMAVAASSNVAAGSLNKTQIAVAAVSTTLNAIKWLGIISAVTFAVERLGTSFATVQQKSQNLLGGFSGLQDALTADLTAYNTALTDLGGDTAQAEKATGVIAGLNTQIENNNSEVNNNIKSQNALNNLVGLGANNASTLSGEFETLNFVLGANTRAWIANAIVQSDSFREMAKNTDAMEAISNAGFDLDQALQAAASGDFDSYLRNLNINAVQSASEFEKVVFGLYNLGEVTAVATKDMGPLGAVLSKIADIVGNLLAFFPRLANEIAIFFGIDFLPVSNNIETIGNATKGAVAEARLLGPVLNSVNQSLADKNAGAYADQLDDLRKKSGGAAKALRTVVDYANDLRTVFARAFEIRFGQQNVLDQIASGWASIAEKADSATRAIADANDEIKELTADRSVLEYQLTVAERYGDEQRAAIIRAKIAKIDSNVADKKKDIADATQDLTKETAGNSQAAIENRQVLQDQLSDYSSLIEMYAKTGLKGKELKNKVNEVRTYIEKGPGQDFARGTAYWMYNGITSYIHNGMTDSRIDDKFNDILIGGTADKLIKKAYDKVIDYV